MPKRQVQVGFSKPHIQKQGDWYYCGYLWHFGRGKAQTPAVAYESWALHCGDLRPVGEMAGGTLRLPTQALDSPHPAEAQKATQKNQKFPSVDRGEWRHFQPSNRSDPRK